MSIKAAMRYHCTLVRVEKSHNTDSINFQWESGVTDKTAVPLWKTVWWFLRKLKTILLTFDPVIVLLGIYPKGLKTYVDKETCTSMSIAVLFIISKTQKQSRYPSVGGQINNYCTSSNGISLTTKKKSAIKPWKDCKEFKYILLSERSQSEKALYWVIPTPWHLEKAILWTHFPPQSVFPIRKLP